MYSNQCVINDPYLPDVFVACESKLESHKNVSRDIREWRRRKWRAHGDSEPNLHLDKCEAFLVTSWIWTRKLQLSLLPVLVFVSRADNKYQEHSLEQIKTRANYTQ